MAIYIEPAYDDTVCATCGRKLPDVATPDTYEFHGFCTMACALGCPGAFDLMGAPAVDLAELPGSRGGPGFERDLVRRWLDAARANAPLMLARHHGEGLLTDRWVWRLHSGGECHAMRMTPKDPAAMMRAVMGGRTEVDSAKDVDSAIDVDSASPMGWWSYDPAHPVADWKYAVANDDTRLGYWAWVEAHRADPPSPDARSGAPLDGSTA